MSGGPSVTRGKHPVGACFLWGGIVQSSITSTHRHTHSHVTHRKLQSLSVELFERYLQQGCVSTEHARTIVHVFLSVSFELFCVYWVT